MSDKYKALLKDMFYFFISIFIPKAIVFILLPLYTSRLSTYEYGVADIVSTTVSLLIPVLTFDINDAVMRFTIEDKENQEPFKIAIGIIIRSFFIIIVIASIIVITKCVVFNYDLIVFFVINYITLAIYGISIAYLRAVDKVKALSIASVLVTIITVISNIISLVILDMGIYGYLLSTCIGYLVADVYVLINVKKTEHVKYEKSNHILKHEMLKYSVPLIAANVSWWINTSSDRYILSYMRGVKENGVYSVAYKIPTILQLLQSIFSQAWLLSVFREYKTETGKKYVEKIFKLYNGSMILSCAILILLDVPMAKFLFAKDFFKAWQYVPFLLISVVFIANASFFESFLSIYKRTDMIAISTFAGALINIVMNIVLINDIGAMGAAIATMVGYLFMWLFRVKPVLKRYSFEINWFELTCGYLLLICEAIFLVNRQSIMFCMICVCLLLFLYRSILRDIILLIKRMYGSILNNRI